MISDWKWKKLAQLFWVKQKVWSFDSVSKVFLLPFLGFGFTFHCFLGNQTDIENSRERERDLLGGTSVVGLENHTIVSIHCLHHFYFCLNFLFFDDEGEIFFFSFFFWEREKIRMFSLLFILM